MRTKHTPGPWKAHKRAEPVGFAEWEIHWSDAGECVAEVVHEEANARLIAAAPDLLAALDEILGSTGNPVFITTSQEQFARAAIAKARGLA